MAETPIPMTVEQLARTVARAKVRERARIAGEIDGFADLALGEGKLDVAEVLAQVSGYVRVAKGEAVFGPLVNAVAVADDDLDLPPVRLTTDDDDIVSLLARRPAAGFTLPRD